MPVLTSANCKTLLQITGSGYDTVIAALIPVVQDDIVQYCKNRFLNGRVYVSGSGIAFTNSDPDTITDSDSQFVTAHFTDGMDIYVENSYNNDGIYEVDTVAAGTLTLASGESLTAEDTGERIITIIKVKFPDALQMTASKMVYWNMKKQGIRGLKSFSLGDYSESYDADGGYPKGLLAELNRYRMTRLR